MIEVDTSIEPPELVGYLDPDDEPEDEPRIHVNVWVTEADGTSRNATTTSEEVTDTQLAEILIACVRGVAAMRGPGLAAAIERRLR